MTENQFCDTKTPTLGPGTDGQTDYRPPHRKPLMWGGKVVKAVAFQHTHTSLSLSLVCICTYFLFLSLSLPLSLSETVRLR